MRAILMDGYGGPDVLYMGETQSPTPGPGEVLFRVTAVGVNPADAKWRSGMFKSFCPLRFPHVPGYDAAGTMEPGGTRVAAMLDSLRQGAYAEYATVAAGHVAAIPDEMGFEAAAAVPTPGLTGVQMIEEHLNVQRGQAVLITGAVGAVGRFAVYAAKRRGARVVAAVREHQREAAAALGADAVVTLGEAWDGPAFDHVADTVGGPPVAELCRHLAPGGLIFTAATTPIPADGLAAAPKFFAVHQDAARLAALLRAVAAGEIVHQVARRLPLEQAAEAHRLVEAGGRGKIVLVM
jgi:NADPH2:quinone reductase